MLNILQQIDLFLWSFPVLFLVVAGGLYYTVRLRFIQLRCLGEALRLTFWGSKAKSGKEASSQGRHRENNGKGVSSFGALCTSLAACIGTGNIVGVALAVQAGGPGAVFWMVVAAFLGMSVMYVECYLAVQYRRRREDGTGYGGPFLYITGALGAGWGWAAVLFAVFGMCSGLLGIGTFTQANSITQAFSAFFCPDEGKLIVMRGFFGDWRCSG